MEDTSQHVKIQLRVENAIYTSLVSSNAVTEILMHGEKSTVLQTITQGEPDTYIVGQFQNPVEVMSVTPIPQQHAQSNEGAQASNFSIVS